MKGLILEHIDQIKKEYFGFDPAIVPDWEFTKFRTSKDNLEKYAVDPKLFIELPNVSTVVDIHVSNLKFDELNDKELLKMLCEIIHIDTLSSDNPRFNFETR